MVRSNVCVRFVLVVCSVSFYSFFRSLLTFVSACCWLLLLGGGGGDDVSDLVVVMRIFSRLRMIGSLIASASDSLAS